MIKAAIIPLRKGSQSIKHKNRKLLLGRPLFSWVLTEAIFSDLDDIYIYTDDDWITEYVMKEYAWTNKIKCLLRLEEDANSTASTESAMINMSKMIGHNYDILCLLQATSPLTTADDINSCLDLVESRACDSALTVVGAKRFQWNSGGESVNYDYNNRPQRQNFEGMLIENGACYATTKEQFLHSNVRIGGKVITVEMPQDTLYEIDEDEDWVVVENLLERRLRSRKKDARHIRAIFLDVDGVLTDGTVMNSTDGEFSKIFSVRDGMGLELARQEGLEVFVVTSETSDIVATRMDKLKIRNLSMGVKDKYAHVEFLIRKHGLDRNEIAYIGDDINDLSNICSVAWGITPKDGMDVVKTKADLVLKNKGGHEAIRESIDFILKYNHKYWR